LGRCVHNCKGVDKYAIQKIDIAHWTLRFCSILLDMIISVFKTIVISIDYTRYS